MAHDSVILRLDGDVHLDDYATAISNLHTLLIGLAEEIVGTDEIEWEVAELASGSTHQVVRGHYHDQAALEEVVDEYVETNRAVHEGRTVERSPKVIMSALAIASLVNGDITAVTFASERDRVVLERPLDDAELAKQVEAGSTKIESIGVVRGYITTIWDEGRPKLALRDELFNRITYLYLEPDQHELARQLWRKDVVAAGHLFRDPGTGRPLEVRPVTHVEIVEKRQSGRLKAARGVLGWDKDDEPAEETIRRVRDGFGEN